MLPTYCAANKHKIYFKKSINYTISFAKFVILIKFYIYLIVNINLKEQLTFKLIEKLKMNF